MSGGAGAWDWLYRDERHASKEWFYRCGVCRRTQLVSVEEVRALKGAVTCFDCGSRRLTSKQPGAPKIAAADGTAVVRDAEGDVTR